jgi:hypothetical protein
MGLYRLYTGHMGHSHIYTNTEQSADNITPNLSNPRFFMTSNKKGQETESNAFVMSNFNKYH